MPGGGGGGGGGPPGAPPGSGGGASGGGASGGPPPPAEAASVTSTTPSGLNGRAHSGVNSNFICSDSGGRVSLTRSRRFAMNGSAFLGTDGSAEK